MKWVKSYESFKSDSVNEEFIGSLLKKLVPDWVKNLSIKNKKEIDVVISKYKDEYAKTSKELTDVLDAKGDKTLDKEKLKKVEELLKKKRTMLDQNLDNQLKELVKDDEKSKSYASLSKNSVKTQLIEEELKQYKESGVEESEFVKDLKVNMEESKKRKEENEKKLKESEKEKTSQISEESVKPGELYIYKNSKGEYRVVRITDDKKLKIVSNKVTSGKFGKEMKKSEDERKISSLFNFEKSDVDAFGPKNWSDLKNWSGEDKFKGE